LGVRRLLGSSPHGLLLIACTVPCCGAFETFPQIEAEPQLFFPFTNGHGVFSPLSSSPAPVSGFVSPHSPRSPKGVSFFSRFCELRPSRLFFFLCPLPFPRDSFSFLCSFFRRRFFTPLLRGQASCNRLQTRRNPPPHPSPLLKSPSFLPCPRTLLSPVLLIKWRFPSSPDSMFLPLAIVCYSSASPSYSSSLLVLRLSLLATSLFFLDAFFPFQVHIPRHTIDSSWLRNPPSLISPRAVSSVLYMSSIVLFCVCPVFPLDPFRPTMSSLSRFPSLPLSPLDPNLLSISSLDKSPAKIPLYFRIRYSSPAFSLPGRFPVSHFSVSPYVKKVLADS